MGVIVNPRGTSGSGKTELVRRILAEYGWSRTRTGNVNGLEIVHRPGRSHPFAYRIRHPSGGRPLVVVGQYQRTSGGCDTIRLQDGGLPEVMRFAADCASRGNDVLMEGLRLSSEVPLSTQLAAHDLHILLLNTPLQQCIRNLVSRRRAARSSIAAIERATAEEHQRVEEACARLRPYATIEVFDLDAALARARKLLELDQIRPPSRTTRRSRL
jgi:hypothetical protein